MDVGDVLAGRYELLDEVGRGGMGRVLRARDRTLDRIVAVKLLAPHLLGDEQAIGALRDEARRAASVRHPNVVQVLDAILEDTDQPAIVMEHVDGPSLADVVGDEGMPTDEALAVLGAVGVGLAAVHAAGLVHRDVTPSNVLLDDGVPRLTDFGIARSATATATQTVRGSVGYLAPEQASGARVGPAADVYALGCLATTLLTGAPPFAASSPIGVVHQHLHEEPPDLRERRPDVPTEVAAAITAALAKAPADRPGSVQDLLAQLGLDPARPAARVGTDVPDGPGVGPTTVLPPAPSTRVIEGEPPTASPSGGTRRTVLALFGAGAIVAAAAVATGVGGDGDPEASTTPVAPTSPSPSPSPSAPPSPSPSPDLPPTEQALTGLRELRTLLLDLEGRDELSNEALEKLDDRAAEAAEKLREGDPREAAKKLRELERDLDEQAREGRIGDTARQELLAGLRQVQDALDAIPRDLGEDRDNEDDDDEDEDDD